MSIKIPPPATKGSQKLFQYVVNEKPDVFRRALTAAEFAPTFTDIAWHSPLKSQRFAEYSDEDFLHLIRCDSLENALARFWPKRGPVWDGLATTDLNDVLLVEAKAHIGELYSPPSSAGEKSLELIKKSLESVKVGLGVQPEHNWTEHFYQYTNRLAHLYFLRVLHRKNAYLVFVYFLNDKEVNGPATPAEWKATLHLMNLLLGTSRNKLSRYIVDVFVDAKPLET